MSLLFGRQERVASITALSLINERTGARNGSIRNVGTSDAMRLSSVWAGLRLRADLVSTMPVDVYRRVNGVQFEQAKPPVLVQPGGPGGVYLPEFIYSTQVDLDSMGNTVAHVVERDSAGRPSVLEPVCIDDVTVRRVKGVWKYKIKGADYDERDIWHERQFTVSGLKVGLSPIAHAAAALSAGLSATEFAAQWFNGVGNSGVPSVHLKNTEQTLKPGEADAIKARLNASARTGEPFVTGRDWEYNMLAARASDAAFVEQQGLTATDAARFVGVPGDMIDAPQNGSAITYANVTQRNLQLLIINLQPAITRRETAFSNGLLPAPRYLKFNPNSLLRMDIGGRYTSYAAGIESRFITPNEARDLEDMPPLTPEQEAEFARLFPEKAPTPIGVNTP